MTVTVDAYNVSSAALILNGLPRFILTRDGIIPYQNITFDITNPHYVNSLLITFFALPFALLIVTLILYVIIITLFRYLTPKTKTIENYGDERALNKYSTKKYPTLYCKNNNFAAFDSLKKVINVGRKKTKSRNEQCQHCRFVWIIIISTSIVAAAMATCLFLQGTLQTDLLIRELNSQSTESKRSIGNFSRRYLPADHHNKSTGIFSRSVNSFFSRFTTYKTMKLYANETTIDASQANAEWFQNRFFLTIIFYASANSFTVLILSIFCLLLIILPHICTRCLLIFCMSCLLIITFMLGLSLTSGVALSDFCLKAKPIIADITVNKMPSNNFTTSFVNYYLHCNLNQWNLDQHKKTLFKVLNRVDRAFSSNVISGIFSNVRNGIEASFDTLHCSELNGLINKGLSEFCQKPVEAFAYLFISYSISYFIFAVILFVITFWI